MRCWLRPMRTVLTGTTRLTGRMDPAEGCWCTPQGSDSRPTQMSNLPAVMPGTLASCPAFPGQLAGVPDIGAGGFDVRVGRLPEP